MERPKLRYAYNEALINTYAEELEKYCDELEKISSTLSKSFSESMFKIYQLNKALDKACEELEELDKSHAYEINKQIVEKKGSSTITFGYQKKDEWKEWLMKDE